MMMLTVERHSATPVYRQILDHVVKLVDTGSLAAGDRLPPTRSLARTIGVHRSTVLRAYEELWAMGYIESRPGSYSTVRLHRPRRSAAAAPAAPGPVDWKAATTPAARTVTTQVARRDLRLHGSVDTSAGMIDLSRLAADHDLTPHEDLRRCLKAALAEDGKGLLDYGDPAGFGPLRATVARRLRVHGVEVSTDEVVVTAGAQAAIDLLLRALATPGDRIAAESPTYMSALPLFRLHGLDVRPIPVRDDGMDLDVLESTLAASRVTTVYTIPNFQNPTGVTTSQSHRERLLALCEQCRVPIIEDGFEEELKYFGKAVLPIKAIDSRGIVAYVGTFSKVVFPGLRVGWLAAPPLLAETVCALQRVTSVAGNTLSQAAIHRFCETGLYETHLRRIHKAYRRRMATMLESLANHLPAVHVEWTRPQGGYTLWLRITHPRYEAPEAEASLHARFLSAGVKLSPGSLFFSDAPATPQFRLSVACLTEPEIREACRRLGSAIEAALVE